MAGAADIHENSSILPCHTVSTGDICCDELSSLFEHSSWRTSCAGDVLDGRMIAARKFRAREIELVTSPWIFCLCHWTIKAAMMLVGSLLLYSCISVGGDLLDGSYPAAQLHTIRVSGFRRSETSTSPLAITAFNLDTGCENISTRHSYGLNFSMHFDPVVRILGFKLYINASQNCRNERLFFNVQGSDDNGKTIRLLGSSVIRWTSKGARFIEDGIDGCITNLAYDYRIPWPWYFGDESVPFLFISGSALLGSGACSIYHHHAAAKSAIVATLVFAAALLFISSAGFLSLGMHREAFYPGVCSPGFSLLAVGLTCADNRVLSLLLVFSVYFLVARALSDCIAFNDCGQLLARPPVAPALFASVGIILLARRRRAVAAAMRGVALDWPRYCRAWLFVLSEPGSRAAMRQLDTFAARQCPPASPTLHQYNRARAAQPTVGYGNSARRPSRLSSILPSPAPSFRRRPSFSFTGAIGSDTATFAAPVTLPGTAQGRVVSMCQLYSQALCVAPLLHSACVEWARVSGGRVALMRADYEPPPLFPATLRRWMRAGLIKEPGRAIAKVLACYDGDVSRLLDVCRCRIVFDCVEDLAWCAEAVAGREEVRVLRLRNGLSEGYDAGLSGGFRAVVMNVCFDSDFTRRLGLENHVCEVQLLHRAFAEVRKAGSHASYVDFRALRGYIRPAFPAASPSLASVAPSPSYLHAAGAVRPGNAGRDNEATRCTWQPEGCPLHPSPFTTSRPADWNAESVSSWRPEPSPGSLHTIPGNVANAGLALAWPAPVEAGLDSEIDGNKPLCTGNMTLSGAAAADANLDLVARNLLSVATTVASACEALAEFDSLQPERGGFDSSRLGQEVDAGLLTALEGAAREVYLRFTLGGSGSLDAHTSDFERALDKSSAYSVLFSSKPFAAYASKPLGKARTLLLAVILAFYAGSNCREVLEDGRGRLTGQLVRIRTLAPVSNGFVIGRFGLLQEDCRLSESSAYPAADGALLATGAGDPAADGYYFTLSGSAPLAGDSIRWVVEVSDDGGGAWAALGRCSWVTVRASADGGQSWRLVGWDGSWLVGCADGAMGLGAEWNAAPLASGTEVRVDFRPSRAHVWIALAFLAVPAGWLVALGSAMLGRVQIYKHILVATLVGFTLWDLAWEAAAWHSGLGVRRGLHEWILWCTLPGLWSAFGFHFIERRLVFIFLVDGLLFLAAFAVLATVVYQEGFATALAVDLSFPMSLSLGAYLVIGSLTFYLLRRRAMVRARRLVWEDRARYDAYWVETLRTHRADCEALAELVVGIAKAIPAGVASPQQMTRSAREFQGATWQMLMEQGWLQLEMVLRLIQRWWRSGTLQRGTAACSVADGYAAGTTDEGSQAADQNGRVRQQYPLFSLDQLFVQALCVQPMLLRKVQEWASTAGGLFPLSGREQSGPLQFARYNLQAGEEGATMFKWCELKSVPRAVEKVIRSYGLDVSRLVDVCRQAIVFEELEGILECLRVIASDPDVAILRIKNRLDPNYDASVSGGYRDVNMNIRFRSAAAVRLGVETHVCELQLMLRGIAELKSEDGHRHYVESRNLRAD